MSVLICSFKLVILIGIFSCSVQQNIKMVQNEITNRVNGWCEALSQALTRHSRIITRRESVINSFKDTYIVEEDGISLLNKIAENIKKMMREKEDAVKRIKEHVEALSEYRQDPIGLQNAYNFYDTNNFTSTEEGNEKIEELEEIEKFWQCTNPPNIPFPKDNCPLPLKEHHHKDDFVDRKKKSKLQKRSSCDSLYDFPDDPEYFRNLTTVYNPHFQTEVNLNYSVVKVSTNIYGGDKVTRENIWLSEPLDTTFKCNYKNDPSLTWQYFASSSGFMRLYPGISWSSEEYNQTFDYRMRPWYTQSMTSPKDIIILLDRSGSMRGRRRIVSKHIVHDILDTLSDNDYVNIYTFANTTEPLVDCFNDTLVQANEENLRLLRESLDLYKTKFPGNVFLGFEKAFEILNNARELKKADKCNQVIMVISEGLDYYDCNNDFLKLHNENKTIRIFTYLLGTEENDAEMMQKIACDNLGYYVNITLVEQVREQIVRYLNVMSRSINLKQDESFKPLWTALYVDLADRRLTNWLWKKEEGIKQREIFLEYARKEAKENGRMFKGGQVHFILNESHEYEKYLTPQEYTYLTTVSLPVYDKRADLTTLLGVAAVDVPIDYINRLTYQHKLGVNGYAFIITNNGYVLMHPDHRTNFQTILKPTFNRVDLTEVELSSDTKDARQFDDNILKLRENIVMQKKGSEVLNVMTHMDDMKRIFLGRRKYYYTGIGPYSLVIALPDGYGLNKIKYKINSLGWDILKMSSNWKIHPKWFYYNKPKDNSLNPEKELIKHLDSSQRKSRTDLLNYLLHNFKLTDWFDGKITYNYWENKFLYESTLTTFLATHTGLTRWKDVIPQAENEKHFSKMYNKAIDELWYKRAVEENYAEPEKFIYSVPFHSADFSETETLVMVTNAIFRGLHPKSTPVAVIGYQMYYKGLKALFNDTKCGDMKYNASQYISGVWTCLVLDNHGYIVLSEDQNNVGKLIADVDVNITQRLEADGVFKPVTVFDYQGICFTNVTTCPQSGKPECRTTKHEKTLTYEKLSIQKTIPTPCDKEMRMYVLQEKYFTHFPKNKTSCKCPYVVQEIKGTNLVVLVYNSTCCVETLNDKLNKHYPIEKEYDVLLPCHIAMYNNYKKRPYIKCIDIHEKEFGLNEKTKQYCGVHVKNLRDEL